MTDDGDDDDGGGDDENVVVVVEIYQVSASHSDCDLETW